MPHKDATTPRVFLIRHGETEWSLSGQYTSKTDIALTAHGEKQVRVTAELLYGPGKLIDPSKVAKALTSPRQRATKTFELISGGKAGYAVDERLAEWDYGDYEGLKTAKIRSLRKSRGLDAEREWDIWTDGCENGESSAQVSSRIDSLIAEIKQLQAPHMKDSEPKDVILVAHGHLTRCFAKRWLGYDLSFPLSLMMEPGGVAVLSYQHHSIEEPGLVMGFGLPVVE